MSKKTYGKQPSITGFFRSKTCDSSNSTKVEVDDYSSDSLNVDRICYDSQCHILALLANKQIQGMVNGQLQNSYLQ